MHDKDFIGILITCIYFVAFVATAFTTYRIVALRDFATQPRSGLWKFWIALTLLLLLLGLNKQLDLQTNFTDGMRLLFRQQGLYQNRRTYQLAFFVFAGITGLLGAGWFVRIARRFDKPTMLASIGVVILMVFILFRIVSFHHVDKLFRIELNSFRVGWLIEISGLLVIIVAACWEWMRVAKQSA